MFHNFLLKTKKMIILLSLSILLMIAHPSDQKKIELTFSQAYSDIETSFFISKNQENIAFLNSAERIPLKGYSLDIGAYFKKSFTYKF